MQIEHSFLTKNDMVLIKEKDEVVLIDKKKDTCYIFNSLTEFAIHGLEQRWDSKVLSDILFAAKYLRFIPVWKSKQGDILITKMSTPHIKACIRMLETKPEYRIDKYEWLNYFYEELENRHEA